MFLVNERVSYTGPNTGCGLKKGTVGTIMGFCTPTIKIKFDGAVSCCDIMSNHIKPVFAEAKIEVGKTYRHNNVGTYKVLMKYYHNNIDGFVAKFKSANVAYPTEEFVFITGKFKHFTEVHVPKVTVRYAKANSCSDWTVEQRPMDNIKATFEDGKLLKVEKLCHKSI